MSIDNISPATKQDISELRDATKQDISELRDATKQDISELRDATKQDISDLRSELREMIVSQANAFEARELRILADGQAREDRILETMRDIETHMVNEFMSFARSNNDRVRTVEAGVSLGAQRLATLEMRVTEIEAKLLKIH